MDAGQRHLEQADRLACNVFLHYQVRVRKVAVDLDVPIVDAVLLFQAHEGESLYLDAAHPNARGHHLIGEALWRFFGGGRGAAALDLHRDSARDVNEPRTSSLPARASSPDPHATARRLRGRFSLSQSAPAGVYARSVELSEAELYDACGNALLLVLLPEPLAFDDGELRGELRGLGLASEADSVLVLTGDPARHEIQGYHVTMDVFEPRGIDANGLPGSWSTMCGNGIGAVACFLGERCPGVGAFTARTRSGDIVVSRASEGEFTASMGRFTAHPEDLAPYVRDRDFAWIREITERRFRTGRILAGLSGHRGAGGRIDGEPQLVVFAKSGVGDLMELVKLAEDLGPLVVSERRVFPHGINLNLSAPRAGRHDQLLACTFERGVDYVTGSSGTGATAVGASFLPGAEGVSAVDVCMPGGVLGISRDGEEYWLRGRARRVFTR